MNILHQHKTAQQLRAIKSTIEIMLSIDDYQFAMHQELEKIDRCDELAECNTVGCMAGWCVVANRGIDDCFECGNDAICEDAANIMGLRIGESHDLFTPKAESAHFNCTEITDSKFVSRSRAILALSYYYWHDKIEWDINTLNKHNYDKKVGALIIVGQ